MVQRTRKIAGNCSDGTCPQVNETTEPDVLAVQGYLPTSAELAAMGIPVGEGVVLVPRSLLDSYRAGT